MADTHSQPADGVVNMVDQLLRNALHRGASDVHFEPGPADMRVRYRTDGLLQEVDRLPGQIAENVIARLKVLAGLLTYRIDIPQEGAFQAEPAWQEGARNVDVRVATFPTVRGERAVVRFLYSGSQVSGIDQLGLAPAMVDGLTAAAERPSGLVLVTGPAGSGKSTTLYALARHVLAATPGRSVVSLEDPVEQRIDGIAQIQVSPHGELTYVRAMRSLLRQDVEVLLVGEIRDADTAHLVVDASLTGHLIMSTLHSGDPAEAIARLIEMGIAPYQIVSALSVVAGQRLLRRCCPDCKAASERSPRAAGFSPRGPSIGKDRSTTKPDFATSDPSVCTACLGTGYRGRTACGQMTAMTEPLRQAILEHRPAGELRRLIREQSPDLTADALRWVEQGVTDMHELRRVLGASTDDLTALRTETARTLPVHRGNGHALV